MQVIPIPCLSDNYAYIINDNNSKVVGVVDPSEAKPVANKKEIMTKSKIRIKRNFLLFRPFHQEIIIDILRCERTPSHHEEVNTKIRKIVVT